MGYTVRLKRMSFSTAILLYGFVSSEKVTYGRVCLSVFASKNFCSRGLEYRLDEKEQSFTSVQDVNGHERRTDSSTSVDDPPELRWFDPTSYLCSLIKPTISTRHFLAIRKPQRTLYFRYMDRPLNIIWHLQQLSQ